MKPNQSDIILLTSVPGLIITSMHLVLFHFSPLFEDSDIIGIFETFW